MDVDEGVSFYFFVEIFVLSDVDVLGWKIDVVI